MIGSLFEGISTAFSSIGDFNNAKSSARWFADEGKQIAKNRIQQIVDLSALQKNAYIRSGVELEGTPQAVMQDTYNIGLQDVQSIQSSYQKRIDNAMKQARANLIGGLLGSGLKIGTSIATMGFGG